MRIKSRVVFADERIQKAYEKLKNSRTEDKKVYDWLNKAFDDLAEDAHSGILIPSRLIPKEY